MTNDDDDDDEDDDDDDDDDNDDKWWMMNDEWWMTNDEWWMMNDEWWMVNDELGMMNDEWWTLSLLSITMNLYELLWTSIGYYRFILPIRLTGVILSSFTHTYPHWSHPCQQRFLRRFTSKKYRSNKRSFFYRNECDTKKNCLLLHTYTTHTLKLPMSTETHVVSWVSREACESYIQQKRTNNARMLSSKLHM